MDKETLDRLKSWFSDYCSGFRFSSTEDQRNIALKEIHTRNVCADMVRIAGEERVAGKSLLVAETVALFHDVGRFEQYRRYRTYRDSDSENHALLGARILQETRVLEMLEEPERRIIIESVRLHNLFSIPRDVASDVKPFLELIRDADKLDIWRVFIEQFRLPVAEQASAAFLGLPLTTTYTSDLLAYLHRGEMISLSRVKVVNDFKLLQMSWIFDLNCKASLRMVEEREYISHLAETLPDDEAIREVVEVLRKHLKERVA
ncbi:HD domain-containing protein [Geobacter sp. DSM 9736]|uniref:HD domain-containing protein n=1 Tax=Geobacter sp. DSM 9736 TaxID=1277350 RepID=UPI000B50350C|nr:HD domain-containing protein [Geobacter sp. DSM 9736]SNB44981.1 HD domain-containing protein [Geobacter sp. DSM 9736]